MGKSTIYVIAVVAVIVALIGINIQNIVHTSLDPLAVNILESDYLASNSDFLQGKNAVVIGGTKGIGRGISLALASAGANVAIVGRSKGDDVLVKMKSVSKNQDSQRFTSHPTDLTTFKDCLKLVDELKIKLPSIDLVVFTLGAWPDSKNLYTSEGYNRVLFLDIIARFVILHRLLPLLTPNGRVMSVLASTHTYPQYIPIESFQQLFNTSRLPTLYDQFYCGMLMDALLLHASRHHPDVTFVGTDPGFVETDLLHTTFPKLIVNFLLSVGRQIGLVISEEESGKRHVAILSQKELTAVSFYDEMPRGRLASKRAENEVIQDWLWMELTTLLNKYETVGV